MTTAFVLSGGASLGAVQVGMADALYAEGIRPDMVVGTSVGAVNGAWLAGDRPIQGLVDLWGSLRSREIFPLRPFVGLRGFVGRTSHFIPNHGLSRLIDRNLTFDRLEDAAIPFSVIVTEVSTGAEVRLERGPARQSILASAALPGVFPTVKIDGRTFFDGGIVDNTPISKAIEAGATEVWVLSTGYSCGLPAVPKNAIAMALHGVALLVQQRFITETSRRTYPVPVHIIPAPCPISVTPIDFSQSVDLIDRARRETLQWLADGLPEAAPPREHLHGTPSPEAE
ncbi:MAG: patatin-like phospholipase family protein [Acidimicrobiales bacterium]